MLSITRSISIPDPELRWSFARSGGPGGQNVNKVASKAILRWDLAGSSSFPEEAKGRLWRQEPGRITTAGELIVTSERYRDQERNRQDCLEKLAAMLRRALIAPRKRKATRPSRASKQERLKQKRLRAQIKSGRRRPAEE
jgi:ribosome-associated protein